MPVISLRRLRIPSTICYVAFVMTLLASLCEPAKAQRWAFYTRQHRYRFGPKDAMCIPDKNKNCNLEIHRGGQGEDSSMKPGEDYSLNFVEFEDNGDPYDPDQIRDAVRGVA